MRRVRVLVVCAASVALFALAAVEGCSSFDGTTTDVVADAASGTEGGGDVDGGGLDTSPQDATTAHTFTAIYARGYGSTVDGGPGTIAPTGMTVDTSGGVIIAGSYAGGPVDVGNHALPSPSGGDAFLVQLDGTGNHLASGVFGDESLQKGGEVVGSGAKLFASFTFDGTMTFDASTANQVSSDGIGANPNSLTARLGPPFQFGALFSFTGAEVTQVTHLALGASDSVITVGDWKNGIKPQSFGSSYNRGSTLPGLVIARVLSGGSTDVVHVDYCPDNTTCIASALASNAAGEPLLGGRFKGTINGSVFDGGTITAGVDDDAYLIKLDALMNPQWLVAFGGSGTQEVTAIAAVPQTNDFVVAGTFSGSFTAPGLPAVAAVDQGFDVFVMRIGAAGSVVWAKTFGGGGDDIVRAITVDKDANVFLTGDFHGPNLSFGGDVLVNADNIGKGTRDVFLAWLDGSGKHVASSAFGSTGDESPVAIGVDGSGNILLAGAFDEAIDFGAGRVRGPGAMNMFVARLAR
jgi:hypothetical protein